MKDKKSFYVYRKGYGHYCGPTSLGQYKMMPDWIDTDNKAWSEPYHLYGDFSDEYIP